MVGAENLPLSLEQTTEGPVSGLTRLSLATTQIEHSAHSNGLVEQLAPKIENGDC